MLKLTAPYLQLWEFRRKTLLDQFQQMSQHTTLKSVEESLELSTIMFLRAYSNRIIRQRELKEVSEHWTEFSTDFSANLPHGSSLSVTGLSHTVSFRLFDFLSANLLSVKAEYAKTKTESRIGLTCFECVISLGDTHFLEHSAQSNALSVAYLYARQTFAREVKILSEIPRLCLDLDAIDRLRELWPSAEQTQAMDLALDKPTQKSPAFYQKLCNGHLCVKLSLEMRAPTFSIVGSTLNLYLDLMTLSSFPIRDRNFHIKETLFDHFRLELTNFKCVMGSDIILKPVCTTADFKKGS
jgi:hypothetical protein